MENQATRRGSPARKGDAGIVGHPAGFPDRSAAAIHEILDRTERNIEALSISQSQTNAMLKDLMAVQAETQKMLQVFIESLTRGATGSTDGPSLPPHTYSQADECRA